MLKSIGCVVIKSLLTMFGKPQHVMTFDISSKKSLAQADINKVKESLAEQGYYLQIPPPQENLLDKHRQQQKPEASA